jgi:hypothetical protein
VRVACYCGTVYTFTYDCQCPDCGSRVFETVKPHGETACEFSERISAFIKQSAEIAQLPEVTDDLR